MYGCELFIVRRVLSRGVWCDLFIDMGVCELWDMCIIVGVCGVIGDVLINPLAWGLKKGKIIHMLSRGI